MSIDIDPFWFSITFTMLFDAVLSVATGVGGCRWPVSDRAICMDVAFRQFSSNPSNSYPMADTIKFLVMLYSTCTGPFYWGIACISVLDFGP